MTQELEIASSEVMSSLVEHSYSQEEGDSLNKVPDSDEVVSLLDQVEQQLQVGGKVHYWIQSYNFYHIILEL